MSRIITILSALVLCAIAQEPKEALRWPATAADRHPQDAFIRILQTWTPDRQRVRVTVQTSARVLRLPESRKHVTLISTVHWSTPEYWRGFADYVESADAVFYEGNTVGATRAEISPSLLWMSRCNSAVARCLGLVEQGEWVKKTQTDKWHPLDMSITVMSEFWEKNNIEVPGAFRTLVQTMEGWARDPGGVSPANKDLIYRQILNDLSGDSSEEFAPELKTLRARREDIIVRGVKEALGSNDRVVLLYGAAHGQALESRIAKECGFRVWATVWHDALAYEYKP